MPGSSCGSGSRSSPAEDEFFHKKLAEMGPDKDMWVLIKAMDGRIPSAEPAGSITRPGVEGQPL